MKKAKSVFIVGRPGLVYRLSSILMALSSERFNGNVNYCSSNSSPRWKRLIACPFDWFVWFIHLIFCDIIFVAAASHHSKQGNYAIKLGKLLRKKVIVDFYISHYEARVIDRKMYDTDSTEGKKFYTIERFALQNATCVTFLNHAEAKYFTDCLHVNLEDIHYLILPVVNDHVYTPADLPWHNGHVERPTFAWWGRSVDNPIHGLDKLIDQFSKLETQANLVLCVDGNRDRECLMQKFGVLEHCNNIQIRTDLNFSDNSLPDFLVKEVDFAVGLLGNTKKTTTVMPNKVLDAIFMGIPVCGTVSAAMRELLDPELLDYFISIHDLKSDAFLSHVPNKNIQEFQKYCSRVSREVLTLKKFGVKVRELIGSL